MAIYLGANELATGGGGGSSNIKTNPLEMPISVINLGFINNADWAISTFWTNYNGKGTYQKDVYDNNRTEIINVTSGSGYLHNVISQSNGRISANTVSSIYITVDGIEYEITGVLNQDSSNNFDRLVFGYVDTNRNTFTGAYSVNKTNTYINNCDFLMQGTLEMIQAPILRFETSLKVEVQIGQIGQQEMSWKVGVTYRIDS